MHTIPISLNISKCGWLLLDFMIWYFMTKKFYEEYCMSALGNE